MEKLEGGLTFIEKNGFISLVKDSGAKEAYAYVGDEVSGDIFKGLLYGEIGADEIRQLTEKDS